MRQKLVVFCLLISSLVLSPLAIGQEVRPVPNAKGYLEIPEAYDYPEFEEAHSPEVLEASIMAGPHLGIVISDSVVDGLSNELQLPAPDYLIEAIEIHGNSATSEARILKIFGIVPQQTVDLQSLEDSRVRLSTDAAFESVEISLEPGSNSFRLKLIIFVKERLNFKFNSYNLGLSEKSRFWLGLDASYLNAFGLGHIVRSAFTASSANEYTLRVSYILPKLGNPSLSLAFAAYSLMATEALFDNDANGEALTLRYPFERISPRHVDNIAVERHGASVSLAYRPLLPLTLFASIQSQALMRDHRNDASLPYLDRYLLPGTSVMSSATVGLRYSNRDKELLPQSGHFVALNVQGSYANAISNYQFLKFEVLHQSNFPLLREHTLRLQTFAGIVLGDPPFFEKFFYNDFYHLAPSRIQNFNPSSSAPFDLFRTGSKTLSYEDFLVSLSFEYAWQRLFNRNGIDRLEFFAAISCAYADSFKHSTISLGTDSKGAKRSSFPIDASFDLGIRLNTDLGLIRITLAHFMNLVPR